MLRRRHFPSCLVSVGMGAGLPLAVMAQPVATIAAASDLQFVLDDLLTQFERNGGRRPRLVYGSSGNLYSQISQGAPFQLFLSADEALVFRLADAGRTLDRGHLYALGRIGVLVPAGSPLKADGTLADLAAALKDGRLKKFAIAHPDHAPYGARAREALTTAGLWPAIRRHLVLGENISQAAQFALSGSAQGGIVALSLAMAPTIAARGSFDLIPAAMHQPLRQRMVLLKDAPPVLREFYQFMATPAARQAMTRHGFSVPPE